MRPGLFVIKSESIDRPLKNQVDLCMSTSGGEHSGDIARITPAFGGVFVNDFTVSAVGIVDPKTAFGAVSNIFILVHSEPSPFSVELLICTRK